MTSRDLRFQLQPLAVLCRTFISWQQQEALDSADVAELSAAARREQPLSRAEYLTLCRSVGARQVSMRNHTRMRQTMLKRAVHLLPEQVGFRLEIESALQEYSSHRWATMQMCLQYARADMQGAPLEQLYAISLAAGALRAQLPALQDRLIAELQISAGRPG